MSEKQKQKVDKFLKSFISILNSPYNLLNFFQRANHVYIDNEERIIETSIEARHMVNPRELNLLDFRNFVFRIVKSDRNIYIYLITTNSITKKVRYTRKFKLEDLNDELMQDMIKKLMKKVESEEITRFDQLLKFIESYV